MPGENQHSFAFGLRSKVVIEAFGTDPALNVLRAVARHATELDQLPAEVAIDATEDVISGFGGELR